MGIFLKHLWLIPNTLKWQSFTKLLPSQGPSKSSNRWCSLKKVFLKRFQLRCFPMKFRKFLRTPILKMICERLLLPFLGSTKLNHSVFLWLWWTHRFLYRNIINCKERMPPLLTSKKVKDKNCFKALKLCHMKLKVIH